MKHLKTLGLAALAVVALTAFVGVSSASATEFHSDPGVALNGVQVNTHVFNVTGSEVKCNTVSFNGTASANGTSTIQKVHPAYSNCKAFGIINAVIHTDGCEYEFDANLKTVNLINCTNGRITLTANSLV
ncbi:MAG TPA: hypothetical protein VFS26_02155, partial [Solirubrobacterales bacterium]|nr:hypothetical protein [Solirubrobacterales bacterium]